MAGVIEYRAATSGELPTLAGYAATFNMPAKIGGMFIEKIAPGAFRTSVIRDDVRALFNHMPSFVLGRTTAGTLALAEDAKGLAFEILPPDTNWARDLITSVERGDVSSMSFQFLARREEWDDSGDMPVRTLLEVELVDISPVTFPAYDATSLLVKAPGTQQGRGISASVVQFANRTARERMRRELGRRAGNLLASLQ